MNQLRQQYESLGEEAKDEFFDALSRFLSNKDNEEKFVKSIEHAHFMDDLLHTDAEPIREPEDCPKCGLSINKRHYECECSTGDNQ